MRRRVHFPPGRDGGVMVRVWRGRALVRIVQDHVGRFGCLWAMSWPNDAQRSRVFSAARALIGGPARPAQPAPQCRKPLTSISGRDGRRISSPPFPPPSFQVPSRLASSECQFQPRPIRARLAPRARPGHPGSLGRSPVNRHTFLPFAVPDAQKPETTGSEHPRHLRRPRAAGRLGRAATGDLAMGPMGGDGDGRLARSQPAIHPSIHSSSLCAAAVQSDSAMRRRRRRRCCPLLLLLLLLLCCCSLLLLPSEPNAQTQPG